MGTNVQSTTHLNLSETEAEWCQDPLHFSQKWTSPFRSISIKHAVYDFLND